MIKNPDIGSVTAFEEHFIQYLKDTAMILMLLVLVLTALSTSSCPNECSCSTSSVPYGQRIVCNRESWQVIPSNIPNDVYYM